MSNASDSTSRSRRLAQGQKLILVVANPSPSSDSDDDEAAATALSHQRFPPETALLLQQPPSPLDPHERPLPSKREPVPLNTANLPRHHASPSNPALSSPSGTSSPPPSGTSTTPPVTPAQSLPPVDIAEDALSSRASEPAIVSNYSSEALAQNHGLSNPNASRTTNFIGKLKSHMHRPHHDRRFSNSRPPSSPSGMTYPQPYNARGLHGARSPQDDKTVILVTGDSDQFHIVHISGFRDAAYIKELIFSKLRIRDEEHSQYSIYRTDIECLALSTALSDDELFQLCRDEGDATGSLRFLVANSSAIVHEPASDSPTAGSIPPPILPSSPYGPSNKRHRSQSRHESMSSTSERIPGDASNSYPPSTSDDMDGPDDHRSTLRAPARTFASSTQNLLPPSPQTARHNILPRPPSPERSQSPSTFFTSERVNLSSAHGERARALKHVPNNVTSPDQLRSPHDEESTLMVSKSSLPYVRPGSEAAADKQSGSAVDEVRQRQARQRDENAERVKARAVPREGQWVLVDGPTGTQENGRSYKSSKPKPKPNPSSPSLFQPYAPPTTPTTPSITDRRSRKEVPRGWAVKSGASPLNPLKIARSMENMRDMRDKEKFQIPGILTPGGGPRPAVPPLPSIPPSSLATISTNGYVARDVPGKSARCDSVGTNLPTPSGPDRSLVASRQSPYPTSGSTTQRFRPLPRQGQSSSQSQAPSSIDSGYGSFIGPRPQLGPPSAPPLPPLPTSPPILSQPPVLIEPHQHSRSAIGDDTTGSQSLPHSVTPHHPMRPLNPSVFSQPFQETPSQASTPSYPIRQLPPIHPLSDQSSTPSSTAPTRALPVFPPSRTTSSNPQPLGLVNDQHKPSPPRSPASPRSPQNSGQERPGILLEPSITSTGTNASLVPNSIGSGTAIQQADAALFNSIQRMITQQANGEDGTMMPTLRPKEFTLPHIPPPPPLSTVRSQAGFVPPQPQSQVSAPATPPLPASIPPTPGTPESNNDSDSESGTLWQKGPVLEDDIGTNSDAGTGIWKAPPRQSRGPPLTVVTMDQQSKTNGSPTKTPGGVYGLPIPANFPPPPNVPPPEPPRAIWGDRTPTARKVVRKKNTPDSSWASRPNPEDLIDRLERWFPNHDLDKPVIEASSGGTSPTAAEYPPIAHVPAVANIQAADKRRHKKSIRVVAEEHKQRISRSSRGQFASSTSFSNNVARKRSTKLWDGHVEEVTPGQIKAGTANIVPDSPSAVGTAAARKPIFKWVRGELIGKGNFGRVYLAMNVTTGEMIAVKQVEIPRTASDKSDTRQLNVVEALKLESETLKDLDHPNIVQYLGFEETPTFLSIFLEYVPGGSVGGCLRKYGRFDEAVTKSFTAQILSGLEYLHSKGILHRDMKADNILVEQTGVCKISDFGISKRTDDINGQNVLTAMQGTVFWMAPEVVNTGKGGYNAKVDIWSLGCIVLEMWAGERPWRKEEAMAVIVKLYSSKQAPPVPQGITLSKQADDFRRRCFAVNPDERPSATELRSHPYLTLPPGWTFSGFVQREVALDEAERF